MFLQATLHSYDAAQYPDLLDIPNRDLETSPTTTTTTINPIIPGITTSNTSFSHKVKISSKQATKLGQQLTVLPPYQLSACSQQ